VFIHYAYLLQEFVQVDKVRMQYVLDALQRCANGMEHARRMAATAADLFADISHVWGWFDRCSWVGQEGWPGRSS
jgi:hypothetical protein